MKIARPRHFLLAGGKRGEQGVVNPNFLLWIGLGFLVLISGAVLGSRVGQEDYLPILAVFGLGLGFLLFFLIGRNFWMLIPVTAGLFGGISILPIPFSYAELGKIAAIGMFMLHVALHRQNFLLRFSRLEIFLLINLAYLATVYLRNPSGLWIFQSDIIGSKSYFSVLLGLLCFIVLSNSIASAKQGKWFPYYYLIPSIFGGSLVAFTWFVPQAARLIYPVWSAVNVEDFAEGGAVDQVDKRISGLADVSRPLILLLCSVYPSIRLILPTFIVPFLLFCGVVVMVGMSGFRVQFMLTGGYMAINSFLRRRFHEIWILGALGLVALFLVVAFHSSGHGLPLNFQRALSVIPFVEWHPAAVAAARETTDWRLRMWQEAIRSDKYIKNKLLGDGFGYARSEFMAMMQRQLRQGGGYDDFDSIEPHLIRGSFHSGPLTTIRVVGIVGLILFLPLMIGYAIYSARLVFKLEGSPYYSAAICLALPLVYMPFEFIFIFGDFRSGLLRIIGLAGYLRLLENSFNVWSRNMERTSGLASQVPESNIPKLESVR